LPGGEFNRYKIFDAPFDRGEGQVMGHEYIQEELVRRINNFVRAGRVDRLIMLHGPNGSAKTSLIQALSKAAEAYSECEDGCLYRFNWIFPIKKAVRGSSLGFSGPEQSENSTYAYLEGNQIESRIPCEHKDHPLLLLDKEYREILFKQLLERKALPPEYAISDILRKGDLSTKNKKIFDAILTSYQGDMRELLKHIQVERFYLSRRYRTAVASVDPQMSVDAYARQVSLDQSMSALPASLHHLSLFETGGPLSDCNRGIIEYNDLLKRPIESWKYLLVATEQAQVNVEVISMFLDSLIIASSNELHLSSFREYPDWQSFKGRFEFIRVPYLLRLQDEIGIYKNQIPRALSGLHIAPHSIEIAARFAVLTRLEAPRMDRYPEAVQDLVLSLTPLEKLELYDASVIPERLSQREGRELRQLISTLYCEYADDENYEGKFGASPREIRTLLLNAAQDKRFDHLSPLAVLSEIKYLVREKSSYEFLRRDPIRDYRNAENLLQVVSNFYVKQLDEEIKAAMGLVNADSHRLSFERYIKHVSSWTKKEKILNPLTGKMMDPDVELMEEMERALLAKTESLDDFRRSLIAQIGAFRLEYPESPVDYNLIFGHYLRRIKESYYARQCRTIEHIQGCYLKIMDGDEKGIDDKDKEQVKLLRKNLNNLGYNDSSARQAIAYLVGRKSLSRLGDL
jgi:serine protein kinase